MDLAAPAGTRRCGEGEGRAAATAAAGGIGSGSSAAEMDRRFLPLVGTFGGENISHEYMIPSFK
jgi:hypothetical protein